MTFYGEKSNKKQLDQKILFYKTNPITRKSAEITIVIDIDVRKLKTDIF